MQQSQYCMQVMDLNMIKWQNVVDYADVVSYYKGMMQIKSGLIFQS